MGNKFVKFVFIFAFLIAFYSSIAVNVVVAETKCTAHPNGDTTCVSSDKKKVSYCWHDPKTREAECVTITAKTDLLQQALEGATIENKLDDTFKTALDNAIQESEDTTKGMNDLTPGSAPLPPLTSDETEEPRKSIGNPKFGDLTEFGNDTKTSEDLSALNDGDLTIGDEGAKDNNSVAMKDLDDQGSMDHFEIQQEVQDNKSKTMTK